MTTNPTSPLRRLQDLMRLRELDYYLVPSSDPHQNEYVPTCWGRRAFLSHFSGSAGTALVGLDQAYLWTDARYFLQAQAQMDRDHWQLMRSGKDLSLPQWLVKQAKPVRLGVDPTVLTPKEADQLEAALSHVGGCVIWLTENLVDLVWDEQPDLPKTGAWIYPMEFAGMESVDKIRSIRATMRESSCKSLVVSRLDSIAWLLNIRGDDIAHCPLTVSYLIMTLDSVKWFVDKSKLSGELAEYLQSQGVGLCAYADYFEALEGLPAPVWLDPESNSVASLQAIASSQTQPSPCPIYAAKAVKNRDEIDGARRAHLADGLALCEFFHWLEHDSPSDLTELSAIDRLLQARKKQKNFFQNSFPTISSFGANGSIIHYSPTPATDRVIDKSSIYLLDSGGQYLGGTTDVTRCVHLGEPTKEQRMHYTLVLKAHLALRQAVFPLGTTGDHLDTLTRQPLWKEGLDFAHGTGHGVGSFLCVHEGPQRISRGSPGVALERGMIISNEPGLYFDGVYGIRIENLCLVSEYIADTPKSESPLQCLCLSDLTLYPYEKNLLDISLLTTQEIKAINHYHSMVYHQLAPHLSNQLIEQWLAVKTNPLSA